MSSSAGQRAAKAPAWVKVTNRLAREILKGVYTCIPGSTAIKTEMYYPPDKSSLGRQRSKIRALLSESDLAQRMPGGLDFLPDVYGSMTGPLAPLARIGRPRSYSQLGVHLVRHLEWYLDPSGQQKPAPMGVSFQFGCPYSLPSSLCAIGCLFVVGIIAGLVPGLIAAASGLLVCNRIAEHIVPRFFVRYEANAIELFHYLTESYSDVSEQANAHPLEIQTP